MRVAAAELRVGEVPVGQRQRAGGFKVSGNLLVSVRAARNIEAIGTRYPSNVPSEITDAIAFMEREWAGMADRQKSGVRGTITQLLDEFLVPPFREIFTEPSTLSIGEMIDQGHLYVQLPAGASVRYGKRGVHRFARCDMPDQGTA